MYNYKQNLNLPAISRLVIVANDVFGTVDAFVREIRFAHRQCELEITEEHSAHGVYYVGAISAALPKMEEYINSFMAKYAERRWVCLAQDYNGYTHKIGDAENGCILNVKQSTGGSKNTNDLTFTALKDSPFFIKEADIMDVLFEAKVVDLRKYGVLDWSVKAGDTFEETLRFYDDAGTLETLTGSTFIMKVVSKSGKVLLTFSTDVDGGITLTEDDKAIELSKNAVQTAIDAGAHKYEVQRTYVSGEVTTVLKGAFLVEGDLI